MKTQHIKIESSIDNLRLPEKDVIFQSEKMLLTSAAVVSKNTTVQVNLESVL